MGSIFNWKIPKHGPHFLARKSLKTWVTILYSGDKITHFGNFCEQFDSFCFKMAKYLICSTFWDNCYTNFNLYSIFLQCYGIYRNLSAFEEVGKIAIQIFPVKSHPG